MMFNFKLLFCDGVQSRSLPNLTDSPLGSCANQFIELEMKATASPYAYSLQLNDEIRRPCSRVCSHAVFQNLISSSYSVVLLILTGVTVVRDTSVCSVIIIFRGSKKACVSVKVLVFVPVEELDKDRVL